VPVIAVRRGADAASYRVRLSRPWLGRNFIVGGLATVAVLAVLSAIAVPGVWRLHTTDPALRSGIETGLTLCAVISAILLFSRFRQTRLLRDLLLLAGLVTVGVTTFVFNTLPGYGYETGVYGAGARSALMVLVAATFVAVAYVPAHRRVEAGRRAAKLAVPAALAWVAFGEVVDIAVGPVPMHGSTGDFRVVASVLAVASLAGLIVAAYGLLSRQSPGDGEAVLLAMAAVLLAVGQLDRLTLAVAPGSWVTISDGLRAATFLLVLTVSVRRYRNSEAQKAREAISAERQRIAQDLHDGLAQDLAFIAAHSDRLARQYGADHPLATAARRALAASRGTIIDLEGSAASDTEGALRQVAGELAWRYGVQVTVRVEAARRADYGRAERRELVRIAREAIVNAIRHGGAHNVTVTLGAPDDEFLLRVSDDGCGFENASAETAGTGLGMRAMGDRARRLGARLTMRRGDSGQTEVDVTSVDGRSRAA
jgi:signal transduction histidine kinase